ncbi:YhgE/Pip family protein [Peribacillus sp. NPDC097206]|uniref:YhgE/Pip family protein n=1 Tax=unclassified Peribacillus TaxID=2675266 RepID=UPI003809D820
MFKSLKGEFLAIIKNPIILISIIGIISIPLLYSGTFLWAFWDPYGKVDQLPVAIVNNDVGAEFNEEELTIGKDLVGELKEKKDFDWHFVSQKEADQGLKNLDYYMKIEIPEDFSKNATTLQDDEPEKLDLIYTSNEGYNYISTKIGDAASEKIKAEVSSAVTKTYAESMFDSLQDVASGLKDASDGAGELKDGTDSVKDGTKELGTGINSAKEGAEKVDEGISSVQSGSVEIQNNLEKLAEKSVTFSNGVGSAASGSKELNQGLQQFSSGFGQMKAGQTELLEGAKKSEAGTGTLATGLQQSLEGFNQIEGKLPTLSEGANGVAAGASQLSSSLNDWSAAASEAKTGAAQVSAGLDEVISGLKQQSQASEDPAEKARLEGLITSLTKINEGSKGVSEGVGKLSASASEISKGSTSLSDGASQVGKGTDALSDGFSQLSEAQGKLASGASELESGQGQLVAGLTTFGESIDTAQNGLGQLTEGSNNLVTGLDQLEDGSKQLSSGTSQLSEGSKSLVAGTDKLKDGSSSLTNGMGELANGAIKLEDGVAKLSDGSKELHDELKDGAEDASDIKADDDVYDMFASPVKVDKMPINNVPNYGTSFAPYLVSLSLFIGAIVLTIIFPLRDPAVIPKNGFGWFISKYSVMALVGLGQAILVDTILILGLEIEVTSIPLFFMISIMASFTFMAIIQFLGAAFDNPGRFIALLILILQLTSSGGTFPNELVPNFLQHFTPFLPMTYSINAFRAVISTGDYGFMWHNLGTLAIFLVVALILSIVYYSLRFKKQKNALAKEEELAV